MTNNVSKYVDVVARIGGSEFIHLESGEIGGLEDLLHDDEVNPEDLAPQLSTALYGKAWADGGSCEMSAEIWLHPENKSGYVRVILPHSGNVLSEGEVGGVSSMEDVVIDWLSDSMDEQIGLVGSEDERVSYHYSGDDVSD